MTDQPTAAAMRAAKTIIDRFTVGPNDWHQKVARIIDDETHIEKLIGMLEIVLDRLIVIYDVEASGTVRDIREVLTLVKGESRAMP